MAGPSEYDKKLAAIDDLAAIVMIKLRDLAWAGERRNPETVRGPPHGARIQTSRSSSVVRITGIAFGWIDRTTPKKRDTTGALPRPRHYVSLCTLGLLWRLRRRFRHSR